MADSPNDCGCNGSGCCGSGTSRRDFLKRAGLAVAAAALAGGAAAEEAPALVGPGPKPDAAWLAGLTARGERKVYRGAELETIGMPCGGVAAGQLYVRGDGTLAQWWIFNNVPNTGYGDRCYRTYRPASPIDQGFAIRVKPEGGAAVVRKLSRDDFDAIEFIGEYPIAEVRYRTQEKPALPVEVTAEIFSPFIPLSARDSGMPVTVLTFKVKNTSAKAAEVAVGGWLQNGVCLDLAGRGDVLSCNRIVRGKTGASVQMSAVSPPTKPKIEERRVTVIDDFEDGTYGKWTIKGDGFGAAPAGGTLPTQQNVSGFQGKRLVNTYLGGDGPQGTAVSKPFKISEPYLAFLIGGGSHKGKTCMNLRIGDRSVRSSTGKDKEALEQQWWDVREFLGQEAQLEIVDAESGPWGHINVDNIYLTNQPPKMFSGPLAEHPGFGDMAITAVAADATAAAAYPSEEALLADLADDGRLTAGDAEPYALGTKRLAAAASAAKLAPGEEKTLVFLVTWNFPNRPKTGRAYANWFKSSLETADYVAANFERLSAETHLFRDTYFDTTLPYWLAARLAMPVSILATETCQWWKDGRF
ncbi:MAG: GH116 family glycosyl-hydrolase, partial [Planctomycetota bacterium]|nr:GH116 family glycosyl-hydrolase [Planctomycetota bacterium]